MIAFPRIIIAVALTVLWSGGDLLANSLIPLGFVPAPSVTQTGPEPGMAVLAEAGQSSTASAVSPRTFRDCPDCPEMVEIPAGKFVMGSSDSESPDEKPAHEVHLDKPIAVGKFEITFAEWDACAAGGCVKNQRPRDEDWGRGRHPVVNVSWNDAKDYITWLSQKAGKPYRLL